MLAWGQSYTLLYLSFLVLLLPPGLVSGRTVAKYIDDEYGDLETGEKPEFKGDRWIRGGICEGCAQGGALKPDPGLAFNGSWHDNTRHVQDPIRSVVFNFTGVSVEIFCILPNRPPTQVTATYDLSFVLDGQPVGNYTHSPDSSADFAYNQSVFSQRNLSSDTKHTMEVNLDSNSTDAIILFDYVKYEVDDGVPDVLPTTSSSSTTAPPSTSSSSPTTTSSDSASKRRLSIILGVVLGTFALATGVLLVWIWRRSRQPHHSPESEIPSEPAPLQPQYVTQIPPTKGRPPQPPESETRSSTVLSSAYDDEGMTSTSYRFSQSERPDTVLPAYESLYRNGSASARIVVNR